MLCEHGHEFLAFSKAAAEILTNYPKLDPATVRVSLHCGCRPGQDPASSVPDPVPAPRPSDDAHAGAGTVCPRCGSCKLGHRGSCGECLDCGMVIGGCG